MRELNQGLFIETITINSLEDEKEVTKIQSLIHWLMTQMLLFRFNRGVYLGE